MRSSFRTCSLSLALGITERRCVCKAPLQRPVTEQQCAGEMRQPKSQKSLADAVAAQQLPKLVALRSAIRFAFMSASPELHEMTYPMGSQNEEVLERRRLQACGMLVSSMKVRLYPHLGHARAVDS